MGMFKKGMVWGLILGIILAVIICSVSRSEEIAKRYLQGILVGLRDDNNVLAGVGLLKKDGNIIILKYGQVIIIPVPEEPVPAGEMSGEAQKPIKGDQ